MILLENTLRSEVSRFEPRQSARGEHINPTMICKPMRNEVAGQILKLQQKRGFLTVSLYIFTIEKSTKNGITKEALFRDDR